VTVVDNLSGLISRVGRWVGLMQRLCNNASVGRYAIKIKFQSRARNEISWELTFLLAAVILKGVLAGGYPYAVYTGVTDVNYSLFKPVCSDAPG